MNVALLGAKRSLSSGLINQTVEPAAGLPSPSVHSKADDAADPCHALHLYLLYLLDHLRSTADFISLRSCRMAFLITPLNRTIGVDITFAAKV